MQEDYYYVYREELDDGEVGVAHVIQCDGEWQFYEWELPLIVAGPFSDLDAAELAKKSN